MAEGAVCVSGALVGVTPAGPGVVAEDVEIGTVAVGAGAVVPVVCVVDGLAAGWLPDMAVDVAAGNPVVAVGTIDGLVVAVTIDVGVTVGTMTGIRAPLPETAVETTVAACAA